MKGYKKNGEPAKPKKDGTARLAGGGYDEKKQRAWCSSVLERAVKLATEMFGNAAEIVVAKYAGVDCGYEGCRRLYKKKYGMKQMQILIRECTQRLAFSRIFNAKYKKFIKVIEEANFKSAINKN